MGTPSLNYFKLDDREDQMARKPSQPNRIAEAQRQYVVSSAPRRSSDSETARAAEQGRMDAMASIRDNILKLPSERTQEIFADFEGAIKTGDLAYLADTVSNWALGGHGYDYAGADVNKSLDALPPLSDDPELLAVWKEYKATTAQQTD